MHLLSLLYESREEIGEKLFGMKLFRPLNSKGGGGLHHSNKKG